MKPDHMHRMDAEFLLRWILHDLDRGSALGIARPLFFTPGEDDPFRLRRYGAVLETPVGAASGPHTQLAQNIVAAWLAGARYLELKTVQALDELNVAKPCIDMEDEGYNCEWSQELKLEDSFNEYLNAWVLLHILHDALGFPGTPGMIFNMSAGYDLKGVQSPPMQTFFDRMTRCGDEVERLKKRLAAVYPRAAGLPIPGRMADSLTISCMHGCPSDEVERIALYFITERRFHTTLKLNPTLLGQENVRGILNDRLGYAVHVPDEAFGHDLRYEQALPILRNCLAAARRTGVAFGVKLTNTLETTNTGRSLPRRESMVYMSGRPLHPISVHLAARLQKDFEGELDMSFSAGVDAFNLPDVLACGLAPVTVCSDLLKPGGYGRLSQYLPILASRMRALAVDSLDGLVLGQAGGPATDRQALAAARVRNLAAYAEKTADPASRYARTARRPSVKTRRPLPRFDCAAAPCMERCAAGQHIPAYLERVAHGDVQGAWRVVMDTNPFPNAQGRTCGRECRTRCMRVHYDAPLRIREIKRFAAEACANMRLTPAPPNGRRAAVAGAGPAGLSCAHYLALAGCAVTVYEAKDFPGGVAVGSGRKAGTASAVFQRDVDNILALGVELRAGFTMDDGALAALEREYDAVYLERSGAVAPVEAIGEGRRAARAILRRLGVPWPRTAPEDKRAADPQILRVRQARRDYGPDAPMLPAAERRNLKPSVDTFSLKDAETEAGRCLQCDLYCGICVTVCPNRANVALETPQLAYCIQEAVREGGNVRITTLAESSLIQAHQIFNIGDFCNECGNCAAFCPSADAPHSHKPRLHVSRGSFEAAVSGYHFSRPGRMEGKHGDRTQELRFDGEAFNYEDQCMRVRLSGAGLRAESVELKSGANRASLLPATEMALVYLIVTEGSSYLRTLC